MNHSCCDFLKGLLFDQSCVLISNLLYEPELFTGELVFKYLKKYRTHLQQVLSACY